MSHFGFSPGAYIYFNFICSVVSRVVATVDQRSVRNFGQIGEQTKQIDVAEIKIG